MTSERWQQIEQLFHAALARPVDERAAFLDEACRDDGALRSEVESLLAADAQDSDRVEAIPANLAARMFTEGRAASIIGQRIGRYHVLAPLGSGGMGEVYLAEDSTLRRKIALKLLPHQYVEDPERVHRFEQEALAASALNHPNIITIHEIGHWQDAQFIVTEFVEGQTLRQRIERGNLSLDEMLDIAVQATSALAAAHSAGIVHRDIKPANIMIRDDGYVKVLDFGLAKLTSDSSPSQSPLASEPKTDPGRVMGTINYMSPEQALGQAVDHRTDLFSFGVVFYEMTTGKLPFAGNSDAAIYDALLNRAPQPLAKSNSRLPAELDRIIRRALEKDRALRYQTAADLCADLKRLQRDSASHSAAAAPTNNRRLRARTLLIAAAIILIVASGAYLLNNWLRHRHPESGGLPTVVSALPQNISFTQQTNQPGTEYFPTLSPDGQTLVYASQELGNWDLWQQTVGQHTHVNLTKDSPSDDTQPAFSPDGQQIAFRSERDGGGLFVMDLSSRRVRKIISEGFNPTWSADGAEIAYGTTSVTVVESHAVSQLWVVRVANGEKRFVTGHDAVQPAWSPHGQRIAFWSDRGNLWTIAAGGGAPVMVIDKGVNWNPCWSADGQYLYFTSDRSGSMNLWRIRIDETSGQLLSAPEPATTPATDMMHLTIARGGGQIAYVQRTKQRRLQALAFDPITETVRSEPFVITRGTGFATHTSVSPDGQWLAYSSAGGPQEDIYIIRTDGTGLRQLTNDVAKDRLPRWSPDGRRIAFFSDRDGQNEIWAVTPDGNSAPEQLTFANSGRTVFPTWSPDGNRLAYYSVGVGSFIIDVRKDWAQQTPQPITIDGVLNADLAVWDWSPDGKKIACGKFRAGSQQAAIAVYTFATENAAPHLEVMAENADFPAWLNDSRRLIFAQVRKLCLADLQSRTPRDLYVFALNEEGEYCALAPDNRTIYYSLATTEADIWLAATSF